MHFVNKLLIGATIVPLAGCIELDAAVDSAHSCDTGECLDSQWARRFGTAADGQGAKGVTLFLNGDVAIGGTYTKSGFSIDEPVSLPSAPSTNGFIALLDAQGKATWASADTGGEVHAVDVDDKGALLVAGHEGIGGTTAMFVSRWDMTAHAQLWKQTLNNVNGQTRAVSIAARGTDVYVVGHNSSNGVDAGCNGVTVDAGMFVAKYDGSGVCQWITNFITAPPGDNVIPSAMTIDATSVWLTGSYNNILGMPDGADPLISAGGYEMFLIGLSHDGGSPISHTYGGSAGGFIEPAAIDVDGQGNVVVAGRVTGKTEFSSTFVKENERGAFVASIDANSDVGVAHSVVLSASTFPNAGAFATGVRVVGSKIHVSGFFAGTMLLDGVSLSVTNVDSANKPANAPFLAAFDVAGPKLLSLDVYPSDEPSAFVPTVVMDASISAVALAGSWQNTVDFSAGAGKNGLLPAFPGAMSEDIFVAKFSIAP